MNAPLQVPPAAGDSGALLSGLVHAALAAFWEQALPLDDQRYRWLCETARRRLGLDPQSEEPTAATLIAQVLAAWPPPAGPLGRLIADLGLDPPQALVLALTGTVEDSHLVTMALAELQAPNSNPRPSLHLADALCAALFGAADSSGPGPGPGSPALDLVDRGLLTLEGTGPRPLGSLRLDPNLWSVLNGRPVRWPGCQPFPRRDPDLLPAAARRELPQLAALLTTRETDGLVVRGNPGSGRGAWAAELAAATGWQALGVGESEWGRDPALALACRYGGWLPVLRPRLGPGEILRLPETGVPVLLLLGTDGAVEGGRLLEIELTPPDEAERRALWERFLAPQTPAPPETPIPATGTKLAHELARELAGSARLGGPAIQRVATAARLTAARTGEPLTLAQVAEARGTLGAERLRLLAQPIPRRVGTEALVLGPQVTAGLDDLILRARRRESLWQGLGASLAATPNPGVRALFVGESGTGKTLAASYVATALGAPLYRVDLAAVMNKYIGESEKNLGALLDLAAGGDLVLLFDEADSLFGRRSEGKETGERYANMLTNFLLTRIETHPGVVLLTSNSRERIDAAFTRRLDLILELPLPGYEERLRLWHSHLGGRGPDDAVCRLLAGACDLAGGQIRNAVLAAATQVGKGPIGAAVLVRAIEGEYRKIGRHPPAQLAGLGRVGQRQPTPPAESSSPGYEPP